MNMKLYHLTTLKALPSILENGLNPDESESSLEAIFLSDCADTAENYCCMRNEDCVLLEIEIQSHEYEFGPDNYELRDAIAYMDEDELSEHQLCEDDTWKDCSWEQSLAICNQIACYTLIPVKNIKVIKQVPKQ